GPSEQLPEVGRQGAAAGRAGRDGQPADQALLRVEAAQHGRALPEELPVHGQGDELVAGLGGDLVALLTRIDGDELARPAARAAPEGAFVARQDGGEPEAAGRGGALGLNPPVAADPHDLDGPELEELEFAPERPAAELAEAQVPAGEGPGQLVEVTGRQR